MFASTARRLVLPVLALLSASVAMAYPEPSPYPKTWELKYELASPKRIVVGEKAYWYVTYHVQNSTGQERVFLPLFEVLTSEGKVVRSDRLIPNQVFDAIKKREGIQFLETYGQIAGDLRIGEDQSRDSVAIWPEFDPEGRTFTLFASGFSGETAKVTGPDGKELTLYKALQVNYSLPGDAKFRQVNEVVEADRKFVMR